MILQAVLIVLKLTGVITSSWWWVLAPLWVGVAASAAAAIVVFTPIRQDGGERLAAQLRRESMRHLPPGPPEGADFATWVRAQETPTVERIVKRRLTVFLLARHKPDRYF